MNFPLVMIGLIILLLACYIRWVDQNNALALATSVIAGLFVGSGILIDE